MNILVTGGLGVNGAWVTGKLVERGCRPVVLENRIDVSLVGEEIANQVELVEADVTELGALIRIFERHKIQRVVHMAALITGIQEELLKGFRRQRRGHCESARGRHQDGRRARRIYQFAGSLWANRRTERASPLCADYGGTSAASIPRV